MPNKPPYLADTRAKGWRFELDYEKIDQSDTWSIAAEIPFAQPALLMMWLAAWKQEPCGSLPNDENVIRAKCRIPAKSWPTLRDVLMRGWALADDGRLYHPTVTARVLEMVDYRAQAAGRKAAYREQMRSSQGSPASVPRDSHGKNDTGTGTGTGTKEKEITPPPPTGVAPLKPKATRRSPADFLVTTELRQWAREHAALVDIRAETGIFRDTEFAKARSDWPATWRAWMAKEQRRHVESAKRDSRRSNVTDLETPKMRAERLRAEEISTLSARKAPIEAPVQPFIIEMETHARLASD